MISMLCLGNGTSASMLSCIPSILSNSKRTNLQFSFGRNFTSPSKVHPCQQALNISCPVICALEGSPIPRRNEKNNNGSARKIAGVSLALAFAIGIITTGFKMNPKAIAGPRELFQKSPPPMVMHATGGKAALESLLNVPGSLASDEVEPPDMKFRLPTNPSMEEVNAIKRHAVQLMKYGKAEEAEVFLENAYKVYQNAPEPAHNVEMALIEILICVGKYEEALNRNCLDESQRLPSDSRFPLYKAIIHTMLDDKEEATRYWGEYMEFVEAGFDPRSL